MNWEEHLEYLNTSTMKELDDKIKEHDDENNKSACDAMNEIHWVLALAQTDKQKVEKIREIEDAYNKGMWKGFHNHLLKNRKERYEKDPEAYKEIAKEANEVSEKLRDDNDA